MERPVKRKNVTVIGGANMDVCGRPAASVILHDSNPGSVTLRPGGVGRNIAHNLALLGCEVNLISAVGNDTFGKALLENLRENGINTGLVRTVAGKRSSSYLYLTDENGDMLAAVNDMDIVEELTPAYLMLHLRSINSSDAVVVDANLSEEAIAFLAKHCTVPLFADPVSTVKAERLKPLMPKLAGLKPNLLEAQSMTGKQEPMAAAVALQEMGVRRVFLSLGEKGILAADGEESIRLPAVKTQVVNTTGAGDAATAAMVYGCINGFDLAETALAAAKAGALTAACNETNNPALSADAIR